MGADVIKVEPPQGDMGRATPPIRNDESVSFVALNRNKRSLVLDLKRPQAIQDPAEARGKSDVFLEAYRPGALDKLGLGAAAVKAVQPLIIYTSVSGFGQTGPDRRRAGVNLIIEAFSGALSVSGEPGKMPMRPGVQTADVFGALFATYATDLHRGLAGAEDVVGGAQVRGQVMPGQEAVLGREVQIAGRRQRRWPEMLGRHAAAHIAVANPSTQRSSGRSTTCPGAKMPML